MFLKMARLFHVCDSFLAKMFNVQQITFHMIEFLKSESVKVLIVNTVLL